jgi:hypothetical protein
LLEDSHAPITMDHRDFLLLLSSSGTSRPEGNSQIDGERLTINNVVFKTRRNSVRFYTIQLTIPVLEEIEREE